MDKEISGEERASLLKRYIESEETKGFYIPTLGEGQIFADTSEAVIALMSMKYATVDSAIIPSNNQIGLSFLKENGFCESETKGKRMFLERRFIGNQPRCLAE